MSEYIYICNSPWPVSCDYNACTKRKIMIWCCNTACRRRRARWVQLHFTHCHCCVWSMGLDVQGQGWTLPKTRRKRCFAALVQDNLAGLSATVGACPSLSQCSMVPLVQGHSGKLKEAAVSFTAIGLFHPALAHEGMQVSNDPCPRFHAKLLYSRFYQRHPEGDQALNHGCSHTLACGVATTWPLNYWSNAL